MNGINGNSKVQALELEALHPPSSADQTTSLRPEPRFVDRVLMLIKLYIEYYPKISSLILFVLIGAFMVIIAPDFKAPVVRNRLQHDYYNISAHYNFKASQMDHWCLWGGDSECSCPDFTEPVPRTSEKGWVEAYAANKKQVQDARIDNPYDIVFVGDEMVERLMGTKGGKPSTETTKVASLFKETFSKDTDNGEFGALALGISGDTTANLIWRMNHGEMPPNLASNVYWLWIGMNDLVRGYCSEEAVVLGILNTAEEISWRDPDAVVVVQGILPISVHGGSLDPPPLKFHANRPAHSVSQAKQMYNFWPSIQAINKELEKFCSAHPHMVYFDAGDLFLGSMANSVYKTKGNYIIHELMPDYIHPSYEGYKVLLKAIKAEMERIMLDDDEDNDVEKKEIPQ